MKTINIGIEHDVSSVNIHQGTWEMLKTECEVSSGYRQKLDRLPAYGKVDGACCPALPNVSISASTKIIMTEHIAQESSKIFR